MNDLITKEFQRINETIKGANNILITSHENPDADAVGSVLAVDSLLKKRGFNSLPYLPEKPLKYLDFLPGFHNIRGEIPLVEFDFIFCLDYGDFERLSLPQGCLEEKIITLDHHLESDHRGKIKIVDSQFSSTAEIIYLLMKETGIAIDKNIATYLLSGIISDTGGFRHISTSPKTLEIASHLISFGVSLKDVSQRVLTLGKPLNVSKVWAEALSKITLDSKNKFVFTWISFDDLQKHQASIFDLDGISSLISTISGASFSLFLVEYERGKIKGSLRSEPYKGKNICELAKALGGSGHSYAAGFKQTGTIEEVVRKVYNLIY